MSAHTPGPWVLTWRPIIDVAGIASVPVADDGRHTANAHLIAAAPDLLAALEILIDCASYGDVIQDADAWATARAAIAKATGK